MFQLKWAETTVKWSKKFDVFATAIRSIRDAYPFKASHRWKLSRIGWFHDLRCIWLLFSSTFLISFTIENESVRCDFTAHNHIVESINILLPMESFRSLFCIFKEKPVKMRISYAFMQQKKIKKIKNTQMLNVKSKWGFSILRFFHLFIET